MLKSKLQKAVATTVLCCMATGAIPTIATAEVTVPENYQEVTTITPRLTYIVDAETDLTISNGTATVDCWVKGSVSTATKSKVIAELQVKSGSNWIAYGTWTDTQTNFKASVYETKSVTAGNTYRVKATYTVWEGSASEDLIIFSDEITA